MAGVYETVVDRESAYERLKGKVVASGLVTGGGGAESRTVGSGWMGGRRETALGGVLGQGEFAAGGYGCAGGGEECGADDGEYGGAAVDSWGVGVAAGWVEAVGIA